MFLSVRLVSTIAVLFFVFILWIIVTSDIGGPNIFIDGVRAIPYGDKFGHMSLYGILAVLVSLSLQSRQPKYWRLPLGCVLVLAFALLEELSQYFFPSTRTLDIQDAVADCLGVYLAAWILTRKYQSTGGT